MRRRNELRDGARAVCAVRSAAARFHPTPSESPTCLAGRLPLSAAAERASRDASQRGGTGRSVHGRTVGLAAVLAKIFADEFSDLVPGASVADRLCSSAAALLTVWKIICIPTAGFRQ